MSYNHSLQYYSAISTYSHYLFYNLSFSLCNSVLLTCYSLLKSSSIAVSLLHLAFEIEFEHLQICISMTALKLSRAVQFCNTTKQSGAHISARFKAIACHRRLSVSLCLPLFSVTLLRTNSHRMESCESKRCPA
jgi:hypothetical protein